MDWCPGSLVWISGCVGLVSWTSTGLVDFSLSLGEKKCPGLTDRQHDRQHQPCCIVNAAVFTVQNRAQDRTMQLEQRWTSARMSFPALWFEGDAAFQTDQGDPIFEIISLKGEIPKAETLNTCLSALSKRIVIFVSILPFSEFGNNRLTCQLLRVACKPHAGKRPGWGSKLSSNQSGWEKVQWWKFARADRLWRVEGCDAPGSAAGTESPMAQCHFKWRSSGQKRKYWGSCLK